MLLKTGIEYNNAESKATTEGFRAADAKISTQQLQEMPKTTSQPGLVRALSLFPNKCIIIQNVLEIMLFMQSTVND